MYSRASADKAKIGISLSLPILTLLVAVWFVALTYGDFKMIDNRLSAVEKHCEAFSETDSEHRVQLEVIKVKLDKIALDVKEIKDALPRAKYIDTTAATNHP